MVSFGENIKILNMLSSRKQVLKAYRAVLSWMHRKSLKIGDRLPAQIELGRELGICQGTLSAAMCLLVEDMVLNRRQKSGTTVLHHMPQNPHRRVWTAGIVMPEFSPSGYFSTLTMELHRELAARNFSDRTYFISPQSAPSSEVDMREPSDFLSLENDLEEGLVDALITSTRLHCERVPCVGMGGDARTNLRVIVDEPYFYETSVRELYSRGVRHIFVIGATREGELLVVQTANQLSPGIRIETIAVASLKEEGTESVITKFLASVGNRQPCGAIIRDDLMASIFASKIAASSDLLPYLCLLTYKNSFLSFPLPALKFIADLRAESVAAVDLIVARLLGGESGEVEVRLPLVLQESNWPPPLPRKMSTAHQLR
ncbi:MAG: GntR family transcriptional regulator [Phycisphaerae bacterium]|jgi:DNA-binding LacI/PurR family transcriptional regulator